LWGAVGGGVGFASGAAIQVWGRPVIPVFPLGWWKVMELTFGGVLGLALGWCAWRHRDELRAHQPTPEQKVLPATGWAIVAIGVGLLLEPALHTRFNYVIVGAVLLSLALMFRAVCWQIAITLTVCAFVLDLVKNLSHPWMYVVVPTLLTVLVTARAPRVKPLFLWLTWTAVVTSLLKSFVPFRSFEPVMMESLFVIMALLITWWSYAGKTHDRTARA